MGILQISCILDVDFHRVEITSVFIKTNILYEMMDEE